MTTTLHSWPSPVDDGWVIYCAAVTLRAAKFAYCRERTKPKSQWTFFLKWEPA